jgi:hypothetical protein
MGIYQKKTSSKGAFRRGFEKKTATHPYIRRRDIRRDSLGGSVSYTAEAQDGARRLGLKFD